MSIRLLTLSCLAALSLTGAAGAEVPRVATDIAPVHSLAARVLDGLGDPALVVRPGATPHGYALRPSEARALQEADAVFWIGPALAPWLEDSLATLASGAEVVTLLDLPGTRTLAFRTGATFAEHDHDGGHHDAADHTMHAEDGAAVDPHAWLDPENAKTWLDTIAVTLGRLDPDNAAAYAANAAAGRAEIDAAAADARDILATVPDLDFVVFHDAYHYFEARFGLAAAGAISLGDASAPSPARVAEVRDSLRALGVSCVFSEPQFNLGLVRTVTDGTGAGIGLIDPLGTDLTPGPDFYPALIRAVATQMAGCGGT